MFFWGVASNDLQELNHPVSSPTTTAAPDSNIAPTACSSHVISFQIKKIRSYYY